MAKTTADLLITELCQRMNWDTSAASQGRADALKALNDAQRRICMPYSLLCLAKTGTVTVLAAGSTAAVPADMDTGKTYAIQRPASGAGAPTSKLTYIPLDEWYEDEADSYLDYETDRPSSFTLVGNTFQFKPANTIAPPAAINYPIIYQQTITAMTDAGASSSVLPEGFEDTILLDNAYAYQMMILNRPGWQDLFSANREDIDAFYQTQRTTKEKPGTDREQSERAGSQSLKPEVQA